MKKEKTESLEKEIEQLKNKLKECENLKDQYLKSWQRSRADFLNYKKEEKERMEEVSKIAKIKLILKILPILDNFEIAEKSLPEKLKNDQNIKGFLLIKKQILDFLKLEGVKEIKSVGEKFNPIFHEAVEEVEDKEKESGIIIEEVQKGYKMGEKILRPAKVKVVK